MNAPSMRSENPIRSLPELRAAVLRWRNAMTIKTWDIHTYSDAAKAMGIGRVYLSMILHGRARPSPDLIARMAAVLGIDVMALMRLFGYTVDDDTPWRRHGPSG